MKLKRQGDDVDKGFAEAAAAADVAARRANQTATLDALFELLFRWAGGRGGGPAQHLRATDAWWQRCMPCQGADREPLNCLTLQGAQDVLCVRPGAAGWRCVAAACPRRYLLMHAGLRQLTRP